MKYQTSILIPARNEEWLGRTIQDVLENTSEACEIVAVLDGAWPTEPIPSHPRVTLIHHAVSIGQRAAINEAAMLSKADYVCKLDAHCRVDKDFDLKLAADCQPNWIISPRLYNLHVFNWKHLPCGTETYQGPIPTACNECSEQGEFERVIVWQPRWNRMTDFMRFDSDLHFQYWRDFKNRPEGKPDLAPTMSILGACWFLPRKLFWELDGCDTAHGSWGQQGTEMAAKVRCFGGEMIASKKVWFSHLFRTQSGFQFPYPLSHKQTEHARQYSKKFWRERQWTKARIPLSAIVERFAPVPGWSDESLAELKASESGAKQFALAQVVEQKGKYIESAADTGLTKGVVYYTENKCPEPIFTAAQKQLSRSLNGHQLVSVSLKPIDFGDNIVLGMERGYVTMFNQILAGLSHLDTDFAFLCEHDCLYPPEHFSFTPPRHDAYFYDENVWRLDAFTGRAWFHCHRSVSGLCADRRLLIDHYRERIARIEKEGFSYRNGFEPGTRSTRHNGYDDFKALSWFSKVPYIDLRHDKNLTKTLRKPEDYRNAKYAAGWTESDRVPGWGVTEGRMEQFLAGIVEGKINSGNSLE